MGSETNRDGIIQVPVGARSGVGHRTLKWTVIAAFLVVLVGTGLIDTLYPVDRPKLQGLERTRDIERRENAKVLDGSWASLVEYDHKLTSRVRKFLGPRYGEFLFRNLKETSTAVVIGDDDWLFLSERVQWPEEARERGVARTAALESALTIRARSLGIDVVWMHIPRKAVVHRDMLPRGIDPAEAAERSIVPALRDRGLIVADLLDVFRELEGDRAAYRKTDSHWSSYGRHAAARELASTAGLSAAPENRIGTIKEVKNNGGPGAILATVEVKARPSDSLLEPPMRLIVVDGGRELPLRDRSAKVVVVGTSFTNGKLARLLSHEMGRDVQHILNEGGSPHAGFSLLFADRMKDPAVPLPELVVLEAPNHFVLNEGLHGKSWPIQRQAAQWLADHAPDALWEIAVPRGSGGLQVEPPGTELKVDGGRQAMSWSEGVLAESGGGLVCLELELEARGEQPSLALIYGECTVAAKLKKGSNRVVLPLISRAPGAQAGRVSVYNKGTGAVVLGKARFVSTLEPRATAAPFGPLTPAGQSRTSQKAAFAPGLRVGASGAVVIERAPGASALSGVTVTLEGADGRSHATTFPSVGPGAPMVVNCGPLCRAEVVRVLVSWETVPGEAEQVLEARLLSLD